MRRYWYRRPSYPLATMPGERVLVGKSVFEEAWDYGKKNVFTPSFLIRLIPFMGWTSMLVSMFQGWGVLQQGIEVSTHLAPGLVQGESVSDAFMADYGARLKIAASVMLGQGLTAASQAVSQALGQALSGATSTTTGTLTEGELGKLGLDELESIGRKYLGDKFDEYKAKAEARADREVNGAFQKIVGDSSIKDKIAALKQEKAGSEVTPEDLKARGLDFASIAASSGSRQDVAALAINALLHQRVYGVNEATFDPATGAPTEALAPEDRSSGNNSSWALTDLLRAQQSGASPEIVADLTEEFQKAKDVDELPNPPDQAWVLIEILRAEKRGADPAYIASLEDKYHVIDQAREAREAAQAAMQGPIRRIDVARIRQKRLARLRAAKEESRVADARERQMPIHVPPSSGILAQIATLAILTAPAWGVVLYLRKRRT